ncbi:MAG: peptide/nickel transport system substrate-binding protein [Candidatus Peregrinibacteria bacterium Greene0416_62]|nr:MAG: peptide/nickel transport system substrate-binding protein [Candidatus Peregrinibacteria bacterium Greene0416_62]TSC99590.1 MAG: peptide/nickel transport system substrate-binding protein [Candidatus Peregrinibacteria bacterium Greene1014_49]
MQNLSQWIAIGRKYERWVFLALVVLFMGSLGILLRRFYLAHSELSPSRGGTYIEGSVGEFQPLNPWFTVQNDVNRDIVSLVFSGLLRYNPETQRIEEDLATMRVSPDARIYTLTLKDDLFWHDSTEEKPHPVTPEDVLFTFTTIQDPDFPNPLLRQNFEGVAVEKINDRTIRFRLDQPYSFFPSNLTLGILPAQSFAGVPVSRLRETVDFGLAPIGAGPYAFKSFAQTERSSEVTLERFFRPGDSPYYLERVILRIFPDYSALLSDIRNLDGVRIVPRNDRGDPVIPRPFTLHEYTLPQYVALFFNLERPVLQDRKLRLGMQLGTDKQQVVRTISESIIVDTPLLEIDTSDWRYHFDPAAAQGALFESNWHLPEKVRLQRLLERSEANSIGPLHIDSVVLLDTGAILTVTGSLSVAGSGARLNGARLETHPTQSGAWIAALATAAGTGSLQIGDNIVRLTKRDGTIIDSAYVWRTTNNALYRQAAEEQRLVELFLQSRTAQIPIEERISVSDLILERGMLRRRLATDPRDVRINEAGERLSLTLLTSPTPESYQKVAENIQAQWRDLGVHVVIEIPDTPQEFEQRLLKRDYDVLLFGESLLDNLDSYPYWHSSGIQRLDTGTANLRLDAYNLSQYASQRSDSLLEIIRETGSEKERTEALRELREILATDVPAIFLYSPLYTFGISQDVSGVSLGTLSLHSDRFLTLHRWYLKEQRALRSGVSWWSFLRWLIP